MNKFYRKPSPETMRKNRESYKEVFKEEIIWFKKNVATLQHTKNKFLIDMYTILITGSRKITPKMASAIKNGIEKCKNNPLFNEELRLEADKKLKPILSVEERKEMLLCFRQIDEIHTYTYETELHDLIENIRPDIRFLGIDYKDRQYTGDDLNIPIHWIDRNHGWSTTKFKKLIAESI